MVESALPTAPAPAAASESAKTSGPTAARREKPAPINNTNSMCDGLFSCRAESKGAPDAASGRPRPSARRLFEAGSQG